MKRRDLSRQREQLYRYSLYIQYIFVISQIIYFANLPILYRRDKISRQKHMRFSRIKIIEIQLKQFLFL